MDSYSKKQMLFEELINESSRAKKLYRNMKVLIDGDATDEEKTKANAKIQRNLAGKSAGADISYAMRVNKTSRDQALEAAQQNVDYGKAVKQNPNSADNTRLDSLDIKATMKNDRKDKKLNKNITK